MGKTYAWTASIARHRSPWESGHRPLIPRCSPGCRHWSCRHLRPALRRMLCGGQGPLQPAEQQHPWGHHAIAGQGALHGGTWFRSCLAQHRHGSVCGRGKWICRAACRRCRGVGGWGGSGPGMGSGTWSGEPPTAAARPAAAPAAAAAAGCAQGSCTLRITHSRTSHGMVAGTACLLSPGQHIS